KIAVVARIAVNQQVVTRTRVQAGAGHGYGRVAAVFLADVAFYRRGVAVGVQSDLYAIAVVAEIRCSREGGGGGIGDKANPLGVFEGAAKINGVAAVGIPKGRIA